MLVARINEKKAELENLKELRDLSAGLAGQMQALEEKLSTLSDGAEVKLPKPKPEDCATVTQTTSDTSLPHTLVRIPVEEQQSLLETQERTKKG
ncbi:MAG: hypothetical protein Q9167_003926 [Letrouitia subvulpina]